MKGPLSADRLFFISALVFVISFALGVALNYFWPIPPEGVMPATDNTANLISMASWVLSIAGVVTFVLGLLARR